VWPCTTYFSCGVLCLCEDTAWNVGRAFNVFSVVTCEVTDGRRLTATAKNQLTPHVNSDSTTVPYRNKLFNCIVHKWNNAGSTGSENTVFLSAPYQRLIGTLYSWYIACSL
jgi:hypothetical protein